MLYLEMNPSCPRNRTATKQQCRGTQKSSTETSNVKSQPNIKRMLSPVPSVFDIRWAST